MKEQIKFSLQVLVWLLVISLAVSFFVPAARAIHIIFGSLIAGFLPGMALGFAFWPNDISKIERVFLCFGLSIIIIPPAIFLLSLIGLKITLANSLLVILFTTLIGLAFMVGQRFLNKPNENNNT